MHDGALDTQCPTWPADRVHPAPAGVDTHLSVNRLNSLSLFKLPVIMQRLFLLIALCLLTFLEPSTSDVPPATVDTSINGLVIEKTFVPEACNRRSQEGDGLAMHYTGRIAESSDSGVKGAVFDSSRKRNQVGSISS